MKSLLIAALLAAAAGAHSVAASHSPNFHLNEDYDARLGISFYSHGKNPYFIANDTAQLYFTKKKGADEVGPLTLALTLYGAKWINVQGAYLKYGEEKFALPATPWKMEPGRAMTEERTLIELTEPRQIEALKAGLAAGNLKIGFLGSSGHEVREVPKLRQSQMLEMLAAYESQKKKRH